MIWRGSRARPWSATVHKSTSESVARVDGVEVDDREILIYAQVYDVAVLAAWTDDADAGYYADESFSGDEMQIIVGKAEKIGRGLAKAAGE